jgi:fibronectin-binding autotransporter adhesin
VTNGTGASGDPTFSIPNVFSITGASLSANIEVTGYASISGTFNQRGGTASNSFAGSLNVSKGLTANSYQGAGLGTCGDASHALSYLQGQFGCQSVTGSGITAQPGIAAGQITFFQSSSIASGSSQLTWDSTNKRFGINAGGTTDTAFEVGGTASIGGNATFGGTGSSTFAGSVNTTKGVHATGNVTTGGLVFATGAGSSSFSAITATNAIHAGGNFTTGGLFLSTNAGSNSFAGGLEVTKGVHVATGLSVSNGDISLGTSGNRINFTGGGTIQAGSGTLTINAFSLGGDITGSNKQITGLSYLSSANASSTQTFEAATGKF